MPIGENSFCTCYNCSRTFGAVEFLDSAHNYWAGLAIFSYRCPHCGALGEARAEPGSIWLGYSYAAGAAHFSAEDELALPGLLVGRQEEELELTLGELHWRLKKGD